MSLRRWGRIAGPLAAVLLYAWIPDTLPDPAGGELVLGRAGRITGAVVAWMAIWWMTECISIFVTALLPALVLPLTGIQELPETTALYAHPLIFLAMGGFVLALALERWELHRRFAVFILGAVGTGPRRLVGGFMIVSASLSMWISNTAAAVIMLPIALSIIAAHDSGARHHRRFRLCLLLGTAYACSIGGMGTLIGTGTNVFLASYSATELGRPISFAAWMAFAAPLVLVLLPLAWWVLTRIVYRLPASAEMERGVGLPASGAWSRGEVRTFAVFCLAVAGWVGQPLFAGMPLLRHLSDPGVALLAVFALFLTPDGTRSGGRLMDWQTAAKLPWGVLLLLGGGLVLADAIDRHGVGAAIAVSSASLEGTPPLLLVLAAATLMSLLTELTSNLASTATLVPVLAAMATGLGVDPLVLIVPTVLAASSAFMLPVATPPNTIIFGSGMLRIPEMVRSGIWINTLAVVLIALVAYPLASLLF